jgi:putative membrane protein
MAEVKMILIRLAIGASLLMVPVALPAPPGSAQQIDEGSQKMMKARDVAFAIKAAQGGAGEVQLGQLAAQKASNIDVKAFGRQMVDDHTKADENLKAAAAKESLTLPSSMDAKDQELFAKLQNESGSRFDNDYVKAMVKDHQEDVKAFEKEAQKGQDPLIKSFAAETLPLFEAHLRHIQSIRLALPSK